MDTKPKTPEQLKPKKTSLVHSPLYLLLLVILAGLLLVAAIYVGKQDNKQSSSNTDNTSTSDSAAKASGKLSLVPDVQTVAPSQELTVEVWEDSGAAPVNAVQANISYPADKFDFVSIDGAGSAFEIEAQASGENGKVIIARGHVGKHTGRQLVAKVKFMAKTSSSEANINFAEDSALLHAETNENILSGSSGGKYTLEAQ